MSKWVYIAGPISVGDTADNIREPILTFYRLRDADVGIVPIIPHLSHFMQIMSPRSWEYWLELDEGLIRRCDALLRLPGESKGADREVAFAKGLGLPVFEGEDAVDDVLWWAARREHDAGMLDRLADAERALGMIRTAVGAHESRGYAALVKAVEAAVEGGES